MVAVATQQHGFQAQQCLALALVASQIHSAGAKEEEREEEEEGVLMDVMVCCMHNTHQTTPLFFCSHSLIPPSILPPSLAPSLPLLPPSPPPLFPSLPPTSLCSLLLQLLLTGPVKCVDLTTPATVVPPSLEALLKLVLPEGHPVYKVIKRFHRNQ